MAEGQVSGCNFPVTNMGVVHAYGRATYAVILYSTYVCGDVLVWRVYMCTYY